MAIDSGFKIAVCDDTEKDRLQIVSMTEKMLQEMQIPNSIRCYEDGSALIADIQKGAKFQLFLLDVMMDKLDGMELARLLRQQENKTDIVFISSNREMAMCGYEVNAARYLAKPLTPDKLREALSYCYHNWRDKKEILLQTGKGQHRTSLSDIQYVEAFDRGTRFVLTNHIVETRLKFSEAEAVLPKTTFILCHRAYIVNVDHVKRIRPFEFELNSGAEVPISKGRYYEINRKFIDRIAD